jgi:hypothetical protein
MDVAMVWKRVRVGISYMTVKSFFFSSGMLEAQYRDPPGCGFCMISLLYSTDRLPSVRGLPPITFHDSNARELHVQVRHDRSSIGFPKLVTIKDV